MVVPLKSRFIQMTEEEFYLFCQEMQDFQIEIDAEGTILIMELTGSETGNFNSEIITEVNLWNRRERTGKTFDSSTGFTLPNNAVKSPDAAWIAIDRWKNISPDFVVEIRSDSVDPDYVFAFPLLEEETSVFLRDFDLKEKDTFLQDPPNHQIFS